MDQQSVGRHWRPAIVYIWGIAQRNAMHSTGDTSVSLCATGTASDSEAANFNSDVWLSEVQYKNLEIQFIAVYVIDNENFVNS